MEPRVKYEHFLSDVGGYLKERALEAKAARDSAAVGSEERTFQAGRALAFGEAIAILQQTMAGFGIPLNTMQLDNLDTDRDL
jgi:hypothetical protein